MEIQLAVAKVSKYAVSNSGDTVEVIERPNGGLSVVIADGQSSGRGAKWISTLVVRKVIALLADGVRDGAAARAASDSLFTERGGKVSSTLNIISVDNKTKSLVITRNNPAPALLIYRGEIEALDAPSQPAGLYRDTRPVITEIPMKIGTTVVVYTDGLVHAGKRAGTPMDVMKNLEDLSRDNVLSPLTFADELLQRAYALDQGRPSDDISVVVVCILPFSGDCVRRMSVRLPL